MPSQWPRSHTIAISDTHLSTSLPRHYLKHHSHTAHPCQSPPPISPSSRPLPIPRHHTPITSPPQLSPRRNLFLQSHTTPKSHSITKPGTNIPKTWKQVSQWSPRPCVWESCCFDVGKGGGGRWWEGERRGCRTRGLYLVLVFFWV